MTEGTLTEIVSYDARRLPEGRIAISSVLSIVACMLRRLSKQTIGIVVHRIQSLECLSTVTPRSTPATAKTLATVADRESADASNEESLKRLEGAQLIRSLNAYAFTEYLKTLGQERMHISVDELMQLARDRGATATNRESRLLCDALVAAGVVFRFRDVIYLNTDEVAETLLTSLPDSESEFEQKVNELKEALHPLEDQKQDIEKTASRFSGVVLWGGFTFLVLQFAVFFRFTFWEYSWDVMEPMAYFVSLFYGIMVYSYFLLVNENFEYEHFRDRLRNFFRQQISKKFDQMRYEKLSNQLARYQKYLARYRL